MAFDFKRAERAVVHRLIRNPLAATKIGRRTPAHGRPLPKTTDPMASLAIAPPGLGVADEEPHWDRNLHFALAQTLRNPPDGDAIEQA